MSNSLGQSAHNEIEDSSSDDDCTMYSGQARRYGKAKMAMFPTGVVQLVEEEEKKSIGGKRFQEIDCASDDSLDDLKPKKAKSDDEDDDGSRVNSKRVETLDDLEEVDISTEISSSIPVREHLSKMDESITVVEDDILPVNDQSLLETTDIDGDSFIEESQTVKIRFRSRVHRLELKKDQYFKTLMQEIATIHKLENVRISLYLNEKPIDPYDTLIKVPVSITDIIEGYIISETSNAPTSQPNEDMLQFKVQTQNRSSSINVSIRKDDPMRVLMEKYAEQSKIELSRLSFQFDGEALQPDDTPNDLDLDGGECIDVYIK